MPRRLYTLRVAMSRAYLIPTAICLFLVMGTAWWYAATIGHLEAGVAKLSRTVASMVSWSHTLDGGGVIRIQVLRWEYASEAEYDRAIIRKMALYPPDPPVEY